MQQQKIYSTTEGPGLERFLGYTVIVCAAGYACFHLWLGGAGVLIWLATTGGSFLAVDFKAFAAIPVLGVDAARHINLIGSTVLVLLLYPLSRETQRHWNFAVDLVFIGLAIAAGVWLEYQAEELIYRESEPNNIDMFLGICAILLTFEIGRRAIGLPIVITV
ncbi:MAG: hypothetical protein QF639_02635, partial [Rhodospirillales bacterium]|nr:hypothetical protein [Rhodospirillales bacterium]